MPDWAAPLVPVLVEHALLPLLVALGAYAISLLPGPVRNALQASVHAKDMDLLTGALSRAAAAAIQAGLTNRSAITAAVGYVTTNLPTTIEKLGPSTQTLETMAAAAVTDALAKAKVVAPVAGQ